jgi:hypothetical protein
MHRDAARIKDGKQVGVTDLVLEAKPDNVELDQGGKRFEGIEGEIRLFQGQFKVGPGGENPFTPPFGIGIDDRIEDLKAMVALPNGVGIGKRHTNPSGDLRWILDDGVEFASDVLGGCFDFAQKFIDPGP